MLWAKSNVQAARLVASAPANSPFFPTNLVSAAFWRSIRPGAIALAASSGGTHSVFGLWPVSLLDDLEEFLKSGASPKVLSYAGSHAPRFVHFDDVTLPNGEAIDPFFNVNTPEDAAHAEEIASTLA